ncbi:energy-coupling factor transporter ATPase [Candidatus Mcinerneyibacteriota bacterium]|nr:energy-coupling factor transporter ATPase [Candidatus Mcinerneyibacteriota bacterium]
MKVSVRNLSHIYLYDTPLETLALDGVTLTLDSRENTAILGQTGSGKSTLIQHFNGILQPTSGAVCIDEKDINKERVEGLRRKVGLVFQFPEIQLFEETVFEDIAFGPKNMGWDKEKIEEAVVRAVELFAPELRTKMEVSPFSLSGGEKRKAALCGVLAMEPEFLCLDEPTAGLDPGAKRDLFMRLGDIHRKGVGLVFITHDINDAMAFADRIIIMADGRVALDRTRQELMKEISLLGELGFAPPDIWILSHYVADLLEEGPFFEEQLFFDLLGKRLFP